MSHEENAGTPLGGPPRRRARSGGSAAVAATALLAAGTAFAAGPGANAAPAVLAAPAAHAARTCSPPKYPGLGYFTSLTVRGVGCATGGKLIVAYYHCRTRSGLAGRCHSTVLGFHCSERRNSIPTEIDGRVTCRRRSATVVHTYQQDI